MIKRFTTISRSKKNKMTNPTHYNYMSWFLSLFNDHRSENEEYLLLLNKFRDAVESERIYFALSKGSEHTPVLHQAAKTRDELYRNVGSIVKTYAVHAKLPQYEAAQKVKRVMDAHRFDPKGKMREKIGIFKSLINDLQRKGLQDDLKALNIDEMIRQIEEQNDIAVLALTERNEEQGMLQDQAMKRARTKTDQAYEEFIYFVECMCGYLQDKDLAHIIHTTNEEIKRTFIEMAAGKHNKQETEMDTNSEANAESAEGNSATNDSEVRTTGVEGQTAVAEGQTQKGPKTLLVIPLNEPSQDCPSSTLDNVQSETLKQGQTHTLPTDVANPTPTQNDGLPAIEEEVPKKAHS